MVQSGLLLLSGLNILYVTGKCVLRIKALSSPPFPLLTVIIITDIFWNILNHLTQP